MLMLRHSAVTALLLFACLVVAAQTENESSSKPRLVSPDTKPQSEADALIAAFMEPVHTAQANDCPQQDCTFRWIPALTQSAQFLAIQHAMNTSTYHGTLEGPFFADWANSVSKYRLTRWTDGDPFIVDYIGHPLMGAVTGRIQIQNDPIGVRQVIGWRKSYWKSRAKALAWSAVYAAQWELGPVSETSIGNIGSFNYISKADGKPTNGTGLVDLVATPVLGTAWLIGEDLLDKHLVSRLETRSRNPFYLTSISVLTPSRSFANLLRFKVPWYRDGAGRVR
jgi:hypothetical protein